MLTETTKKMLRVKTSSRRSSIFYDMVICESVPNIVWIIFFILFKNRKKNKKINVYIVTKLKVSYNR